MPKFAMRCSFGIYVFFLGCVHVYGQNCKKDSVGHTLYGPGCKYLCHCYDSNEQCDRTTGRCASGCANEWMGPGCQYRNILWRKFTNQFDRQNAREAIDGNVDTCSRSFSRIGPIWWRAWFEQYEMIRGLTFITEKAHLGSFKRFTVYVEKNSEKSNDTGFQQQDMCYKHNGVSFITTTMTVICNRPLRGNQIRIQLDSTQTYLVLCDVRVFGGRNLAYSKQTSQSNNFEDRISANAVDGSTESPQCALTKSVVDLPRVWTLNLGNVFHVEALQLIGLHNFQQDDTIQARNNSYWNSITFDASGNKTLSFTTDVTLQHLQFRRTLGYISLCEVLVFGDCLDNVCGLNCNIPCHCAVFTFENKVSGECLEGCAGGWTGHGRRCDTGNKVCVEGRYGPNCTQMCSEHCSTSRVCNKTDGRCVAGCEPGWDGPTCYQECPNDSYGANCSDRCSSNCQKEKMCDKKNGICEGGCKAGWQGLTCLKECNNDTYGAECSGQCSGHCMYNDVCDKVDGRCARGCTAGWMGDQCDEEINCPVHTFGLDCTPCGPCKNGSCDPVTGECPSGCYDGYVGSMCETFNNDAMYTVNALLVGAGMGVVITLLVAAVTVAVLWKIKQSPHIYEEPLAMTSSGPINEPAYDTCQDQERKNENDSDQEHVYMN